jgi:hypothetical protein
MARTVKSCGPGLPLLRPSSRCLLTSIVDDGGKNAGPRGEYVQAVKPIAQGRPDDPVRTCGSAACFLLHADHGCDRRPAFPAPSSWMSARETSITRAESAAGVMKRACCLIGLEHECMVANAAQTVSTTAPSPLVGEGITAISVKLVRVRGCLFARQSMPHETPHPACIWRCAPPSPAGGEGTPVARIQIGITISSTPADRHAAWPAISRPRRDRRPVRRAGPWRWS